MTVRHLRALWRQPWWIVVTLIQPIIWLLLYGALFKRVVEIPGFHGGSYIEFLTPGVVVMTAFFSAGWGGMAMIEDIDRGVIDRFLVSPVAAQLADQRPAAPELVQHRHPIADRDRPGADRRGVVLERRRWRRAPDPVRDHPRRGFGALSNGLALMVRKRGDADRDDAVPAAPAHVPVGGVHAAQPGAGLDPAHLGLQPGELGRGGGRDRRRGGTDWGFVASRFGFLLAFLVLSGTFAVRALRRYQQTV